MKHTLPLLFLALLTACSGDQSRRDEQENDSTRAAREALAEFRRLSKDRTALTRLTPGVSYTILREGDGPIAGDTATVTVHYEGRLANGQIFDSSYERGKPWVTRTDSVIRGWKDVFRAMPCGSKWFVLVGYEKAYGDQGVPGVIPPFADLFFTIELLDAK